MRRCDVKMRRCEDVKMFDRPSLLEEPFAQALSGKNLLNNTSFLSLRTLCLLTFLQFLCANQAVPFLMILSVCPSICFFGGIHGCLPAKHAEFKVRYIVAPVVLLQSGLAGAGILVTTSF